jgi:hypothetical protein
MVTAGVLISEKFFIYEHIPHVLGYITVIEAVFFSLLQQG